jgi:hypothetical protein
MGVLARLSVVVVLLLATAGSARASGWAIQPSVNLTAPRAEFSALACRSTTMCLAVGTSPSERGRTLALAERWNGSSWGIRPAAQPAAADSVTLNGVACPTPSACEAVGSYVNAAGAQVTLAEHWNGSSFAIETTPNPAGAAKSELDAVSCDAASSCTAVGSSDGSALVERWNGSSWTIQSTPAPPAGTDYALSGVSCPSSVACFAVGSQTPSRDTSSPLAMAWSVSGWTVQTLPSGHGSLSAITCRTSNYCVAVGKTGLGTVERWNGVSWGIWRSNFHATLTSVSCTSAHACTVAGYVGVGSGAPSYAGIAERWSNGTWTQQQVPTPPNTSWVLIHGVSCPTATDCEAVGSTDPTQGPAVAAHWNGSAWSDASTVSPTGAIDSALVGVSCPTTTACVAVGGGDALLAEHRNGGAWSADPVPSAPNALLDGVSCSAFSACTAVGLSKNGMLADRWNGSSWTSQTFTTNSASDYLLAVSCPDAAACTAVGAINYQTPLVEHWNGATWTRQTVPILGGQEVLLGVACSGPTVCTAVGSYHDSFTTTILPFAARWDGTQWTTQTVPSPHGTSETVLNAVSCPSPTACTAAGWYTGGPGRASFAVHWNGTRWTIQTTPNPTSGIDNELVAISCTAPGFCTTLGSTVDAAGKGSTLVAHSQGATWTVDSTPNPFAPYSYLDAVSCLTRSLCTAVGALQDVLAVPSATLIERRTP